MSSCVNSVWNCFKLKQNKTADIYCFLKKRGPFDFLCTQCSVQWVVTARQMSYITLGRSSQHSCKPCLTQDMHTCSAVSVLLNMFPLFCILLFYVALVILIIFLKTPSDSVSWCVPSMETDSHKMAEKG